jgi:hypothetical protein
MALSSTYGNQQGIGAPTPSGIPGFNAANVAVVSGSATQSTTTQSLPSWLNVITVNATTNAALMLPPAYAGDQVVVINNGVQSATIYGNYVGNSTTVTDTIAAHNVTTQVTTGVAVASGAIEVFFCMQGQSGQTNNPTAGQWKALI